MKTIDVKGSSSPVIVDDEDYEMFARFLWRATSRERGGRITLRPYGMIKPHHLILGKPPKGYVVDHINRNPFDCRRDNLRFVTLSQNNMNSSKRKNSTSIYKGVNLHKASKRWRASLTLDYKYYHLGYFASEVEAAKAYDKKAKELFGEFAHLNFPEDSQ